MSTHGQGQIPIQMDRIQIDLLGMLSTASMAVAKVMSGCLQVGQAAVNHVSEVCDRAVQKEVSRIQGEVAQAAHIAGKIDLSEAALPVQTTVVSIVKDNTTEIAKTQELLNFYAHQASARKAVERDEGLKPVLSAELEKEVESYQIQLNKLNKDKAQKEAEAESIWKKQSTDARRNLAHSLAMCDALQHYFPESISSLKNHMIAELEKDKPSTHTLADIEREIETRFAAIKSPSKVKMMDEVLRLRLSVESNPIVAQNLSTVENHALASAFQKLMDKASAGTLAQNDLTKMQDKLQDTQELARDREQHTRVKEWQDKTVLALRAICEPKSVRIEENPKHKKGFIHISGKSAKGVTMGMFIPKAETLHTDPDAKVEHYVTEEPGVTKEVCHTVDSQLIHEVRSLGLDYRVKYTKTHFKGELTEDALVELQDRAKAMNPLMKVVKMGECEVKITNGQTTRQVVWDPHESLDVVLKKVEDVLKGSGSKQGLSEGGKIAEKN